MINNYDIVRKRRGVPPTFSKGGEEIRRSHLFPLQSPTCWRWIPAKPTAEAEGVQI